MTPTEELAWTAGLFEGEGTVGIRMMRRTTTHDSYGCLYVSVVNTDREVIEWFDKRWPAYMKSVRFGARSKVNHRPAWRWITAARKAALFLAAIQPYIVRAAVREKVKVALEFQAAKRNGFTRRSEEEKHAYAQEQWESGMWMAYLNRRGEARKPRAKDPV